MEAFHELKVNCPYEILEIEDMRISNKPNEHGSLYLKVLVDEDVNFKYAIEASTDDKICIYEETENQEKTIIFNGTIQNIRTSNVNRLYYMEIEALTSSFSFDIQEKSRSFQDAEMSYDDLINTILRDYKIYSFTQCMDKPMSIGRPLFQYKETDYEFLKRVASHLGLELICDIINTNNVFYFGRPTGKSYEIEDDIDYSASLDVKKYRECLGYSDDFHPTDFFYYEIKSKKVMEIGAKITFKAKELYINSYEAEYVRGDLIFTYKLCRQKGIWQEKLYNEKIKGISLEGKVMEVSGEQVKLHLNIDEAQSQSKAAWFRYAPPTGNLMYSMPIVGTNANLYFSSERTEDPMVIGCVRKNGSSCENFSNVNNRYFATESGNNLDLLPGAINFSRPGLSANFNDGSGITLSSSSSLSINAGYVGMFAGNVSIKGTTKLVAEKGGSFLSLENEFYNDAGIVMENGSDRASNEKFTDDEPTNGVAKARAAMEAQMNIVALADANQGTNPVVGDITSENDPLNLYSNKPWMNNLNTKSADNDCYIKPANNNSRPINKWDECKETIKDAWDYGKSALNAVSDVGSKLYFSAFQCIPKIGRVFANDEKSNAYWDTVEKSIDDQIDNMDYNFYKSSPNKDVFDGVKALSGFGAGFTPADTYVDTVSFINGKDAVTGEDANRGVLFACILLPEVLDKGVKVAAKNGDNIAEEAIKQGDSLADIVKKVKKKSKRLKYMGKTPGKSSRTGKEVIERMKGEGKIRTVRGKMQFKASDNKWYDISKADMAHKIDAVHWWNTVGRNYGAKSEQVRDFMLDSNNYYLEHYSINRSQGALLNEDYLPPLK